METCDPLKNCPFCGTVPALPPTDKLVCCTNHFCSIYGRHMPVKPWNTRIVEAAVLSRDWVDETPVTDFNESLQREAYQSQLEAGYPSFPCDFDGARAMERQLNRCNQIRVEQARAIARVVRVLKKMIG